ncbi:hypothetical protein AX16_009338 [Volvariella volvacea WC 439]|nr:hypothetical protein AX16_009338 [Volvariella volvacea WC 439]
MIAPTSSVVINDSFVAILGMPGSLTEWRDLTPNWIARQAMYDADHRANDLKCHKDTRVVIREDIDSWVLDVNRVGSILWVKGAPGTGKSALARTVALKFDGKGPGILADTFFFWRGDPTRNDPKNFVVTIAFQFARAFKQVGEALNRVFGADPSVSPLGDLREQWTRLMAWTSAIHWINHASSTYSFV